MNEMSVTRQIADNIRVLRARQRWSAQQLAEECIRVGSTTLTRSTIAKIESGLRKHVTADELAVLARVLGVNPADLLSGITPAGLATEGTALARIPHTDNLPPGSRAPAPVYRLLGELEIGLEGRFIDLPSGTTLMILAALVANANRRISKAELIRTGWGVDHIEEAQLYKRIKAVRDLLVKIGRQSDLENHAGFGYELRVADEDVDALLFMQLVGKAEKAKDEQRTEDETGSLREALRLWRGAHPLANVPGEIFRRDVSELEQRHKRAATRLFDLELASGNHEGILDELMRVASFHPSDRRLCEQLMVTEYRCGRVADATRVYGRYQEALGEETGAGPDTAMKSLNSAIARGDEGAIASVEAAIAQRTGMAATSIMRALRRPPAPPMQLPLDISDFTGRAQDVARLCELQPGSEADDSAGSVMVALVTGAAGLGKTTLAVHAAHRLRSRFPDGQLYVDLLGVSAQPLAPTDVLARFLRELGADPAQLPADEQERAVLYRTWLTGRRALILLDNARDYTQIRPLLPGSSSCSVLVTSRKALLDLPTTQLVDLDVLDAAEARALFAGIVGAERTNAEPVATSKVLAACAGLPLAIRIAGVRLAARPRWTVRTLADRLRNQHGRLDVLKVGDLAVRTSFEVSYADLPPATTPDGIDPAQAFRLLGLWQGPTISLAAAAALFGQPDTETIDALERLVDMHLLESPAPDVYRFHDLLRVYAAERSTAEPGQVREDAIRRILSWYLHTAEAVARVISPNHARVPVGDPAPAVRPLVFGSLEAALDWSEAERASLVAAARQAAEASLHDIAWQLPAAAMSFFYRRSHWADWILTHQIGLASARTLGDRRGEAWMLNNLGIVHGEQRKEEAIGFFERAAAINHEIGDRGSQARAMTNIVTGLAHLGRFNEALEASHRSLALQRELGRRYGEGITLSSMGWANRQLGKSEGAIACLQQALVIFRELGDNMAEADTLSELGDAYLGTNLVGEAMACLRESLAIQQNIGDRHRQATTLQRLGKTLRQTGRLDEARESLTEAQQISEELGDHEQIAEIRTSLIQLQDV